MRQLPGNVLLSATAGRDEQDKRMKGSCATICTGCHTASYVLQHRFDEAGWSAIVELMKNVNVYGTYIGASPHAVAASSISTRRSWLPISRRRAVPARTA